MMQTCHFVQDEYEIVLTNPLPRPVIAEVLLANEIHRTSPALANLTMDEALPAYVEVCMGHMPISKGHGHGMPHLYHPCSMAPFHKLPRIIGYSHPAMLTHSGGTSPAQYNTMQAAAHYEIDKSRRGPISMRPHEVIRVRVRHKPRDDVMRAIANQVMPREHVTLVYVYSTLGFIEFAAVSSPVTGGVYLHRAHEELYFASLKDIHQPLVRCKTCCLKAASHWWLQGTCTRAG
jgi:hypothetical protein